MKKNEITRVESTCKTIASMTDRIAAVVPKQVPSAKFMRNTMLAIQSPDIADKINSGKVDMNTLYIAIEKAASDGLLLDSKEAAIVAFWNKDKGKSDITYMPMVAGIIKHCRNSGELVSISAHVVYKNDHFKHIKSPNEMIEHSSVPLDEDPGEPIGVYASATLKSGETVYCVMRKEQVIAVKHIAKTKKIWEGPFADQMWEKAAIRRLSKRLPSSTDLDKLFEHDNENYDLDNAVDITPGEFKEELPEGKQQSEDKAEKKAEKKEEKKTNQSKIEDALGEEQPPIEAYEKEAGDATPEGEI